MPPEPPDPRTLVRVGPSVAALPVPVRLTSPHGNGPALLPRPPGPPRPAAEHRHGDHLRPARRALGGHAGRRRLLRRIHLDHRQHARTADFQLRRMRAPGQGRQRLVRPPGWRDRAPERGWDLDPVRKRGPAWSQGHLPGRGAGKGWQAGRLGGDLWRRIGPLCPRALDPAGGTGRSAVPAPVEAHSQPGAWARGRPVGLRRRGNPGPPRPRRRPSALPRPPSGLHQPPAREPRRAGAPRIVGEHLRGRHRPPPGRPLELPHHPAGPAEQLHHGCGGNPDALGHAGALVRQRGRPHPARGRGAADLHRAVRPRDGRHLPPLPRSPAGGRPLDRHPRRWPAALPRGELADPRRPVRSSRKLHPQPGPGAARRRRDHRPRGHVAGHRPLPGGTLARHPAAAGPRFNEDQCAARVPARRTTGALGGDPDRPPPPRRRALDTVCGGFGTAEPGDQRAHGGP